jgi:hypothetical protein
VTFFGVLSRRAPPSRSSIPARLKMYKRTKIQDMGIPDLRMLPENAGSSQFLNPFSFHLTRVLIMSILIYLLMQTFLAKGLVLSSLHITLVSFSFLTTYHVVDAVVGPIPVEIPLDHFNHSDKRTFQNRYWMNDTYYEKGGPIFMYDNGELGISDSQATGLLDGSEVFFSALELAKKYKGIVLEWEHRFFGGSMPFDYNATTGVAIAEYDAYKYLTDDQALEDVVYFAKHFQPPGHENDTLTSYSTPWIWIGASYAGYRAAMIRLRNPDVIFASWSSSGPVETAVDASAYYNQIQQNIPSNCSADVHAAVTYADDILTDGSEEDAALIKRAIFLSNTLNPKGDQIYAGVLEDISYWDIANILSYPFQAAFLSFQSFGYRIALEKFCTQLEIYNPSNSTPFTITSPASVLFNNSLNLPPTSSGVAATFSPKDAFYSYLYAVIQNPWMTMLSSLETLETHPISPPGRGCSATKTANGKSHNTPHQKTSSPDSTMSPAPKSTIAMLCFLTHHLYQKSKHS